MQQAGMHRQGAREGTLPQLLSTPMEKAEMNWGTIMAAMGGHRDRWGSSASPPKIESGRPQEDEAPNLDARKKTKRS